MKIVRRDNGVSRIDPLLSYARANTFRFDAGHSHRIDAVSRQHLASFNVDCFCKVFIGLLVSVENLE